MTLTSNMAAQLKNLDDARDMIETDLAPIFDEIMSRLRIAAHLWNLVRNSSLCSLKVPYIYLDQLHMGVNSLKTCISHSDAQFALKEVRK